VLLSGSLLNVCQEFLLIPCSELVLNIYFITGQMFHCLADVHDGL
jgi:peptidoglycan biosynthesis protein MviN/MurJ (putative lipid II flippase)